MNSFENTLAFAQQCDQSDKLNAYRQQFIFPKLNGQPVIYFTGNSLGLQPKIAKDYVNEIMDAWADLAVDGHFHAEKPWWDYHERLAPSLAKIVGALAEEITVMNTLTVNLHLLMVSFYRPTPQRYKIICEEKAFPSDQYMLHSQLRYHGFDPNDALIEIKRRAGEHFWRTEDILQAFEKHQNELALVFIGGVNYYNGQVFDMKTITESGHKAGAFVGWDLAHAAGNIKLQLHDWEVDFAAWCSYKYMNSGPGNASGVFVHQRHLDKKDVPRFEGWWGNDKPTRFLMKPQFDPMPNADAWQLSNAPTLSLAPYLASLRLFDEVGMDALEEKSKKLTDFLEYILKETPDYQSNFEIITPKNRGCQLSLLIKKNGRKLFSYLSEQGVVTDWREPNVIRLAPAPFYCSFEQMFRFGEIFRAGLKTISK